MLIDANRTVAHDSEICITHYQRFSLATSVITHYQRSSLFMVKENLWDQGEFLFVCLFVCFGLGINLGYQSGKVTKVQSFNAIFFYSPSLPVVLNDYKERNACSHLLSIALECQSR